MRTDPMKKVGGPSRTEVSPPTIQEEKSKIDMLRNRIPFTTTPKAASKKYQFSKKLPTAEAKVNDRLAGPLKRALSRAA